MAYEPHFIDRDPRPKTHPCTKCARDVETGKRCICVPSQPFATTHDGGVTFQPFVIR